MGSNLYRRGYGVGVTGVDDYAALSALVFGDRSILLAEPWLVADDLSLAMGAAMYKWMQRDTRGRTDVIYPSGHEIATGLWAGNDIIKTQDPNTLIELSQNQLSDGVKTCADFT